MKEFVHGDLGRTVPSIGGLLGGQVRGTRYQPFHVILQQADILQLDVAQLFDEFDDCEDHKEVLEGGCARCGLPSMPLEELKSMRIPSMRKKVTCDSSNSMAGIEG